MCVWCMGVCVYVVCVWCVGVCVCGMCVCVCGVWVCVCVVYGCAHVVCGCVCVSISVYTQGNGTTLALRFDLPPNLTGLQYCSLQGVDKARNIIILVYILHA